ncbi:hypothetical protein FUAX_43660 (plasmid) [Fulvitalea axinellae]|uniref:DUF465 domain-containing protein n=1 Tax=Fulvitalea axinellae TaxID=1182444 RepID=A0AAU9CZJ4_9BACT|nr:hypothetical protein FUAX_43660 [Fulvitalea axinellae]
MSNYRTTLIQKYQADLQEKQASVAELDALLPDFDNLLDSQYALREKKRLTDRKVKLNEEITQLTALLQDMQNEVDDTTPIA